MSRDQSWWIDLYKEKEAFWVHDGNKLRPHALLSSGNHSDGFANSEFVIQDPTLLDQAASDLVARLGQSGLGGLAVNRVIGPAMGAITFAHDVARQFALQRGLPCLTAFTEKGERDGQKIMTLARRKLRPGESCLPVEDVVTTGGSVEKAIQAILDAGGTVPMFVGALVNRSGLTEVGGRRIVALINHPMPMWAPSECPLCKMGSEAILAKAAGNWARLNAEYPVEQAVAT